MITFVYDPTEATLDYGFYRCIGCDKSFFGGGPSLHNQGCPYTTEFLGQRTADEAIANYEYHFGDVELAAVSRGEIRGRLTHSVLEKQFPHLLSANQEPPQK